MLARELHDRARGRHPLRHLRHAPEDLLQGLSRAESFPHGSVSGERHETREHDVARAGEPREGGGLRAHALREPSNLRASLRDDGREGVVAELEAVDDAGGDGEDVLERPAHLHAHDVRGRVHAQARRGEQPLHGDRQVFIRRRRDDRGRETLHELHRERGPAEHRQRLVAAQTRRDHLRHHLARTHLQTLAQAKQRRLRIDVFLHARQKFLAGLHRDGVDDEVGAAESLGGVDGGVNLGRELVLGEVLGVAMGVVDGVGVRLGTNEDGDVESLLVASEERGHGGAEGAAAHDGHLVGLAEDILGRPVLVIATVAPADDLVPGLVRGHALLLGDTLHEALVRAGGLGRVV